MSAVRCPSGRGEAQPPAHVRGLARRAPLWLLFIVRVVLILAACAALGALEGLINGPVPR